MGIADAYLQLAYATMNLGKYDEALKINNDALMIYDHLVISEKSSDKSSILKQKARTYINTGIVFWYQGKYPEALKQQFTALKIANEISDKPGMAISYNNIGLVYGSQGNSPEALKNQLAALKIFEKIGDKRRIANSYINIGTIYRNQYNFPERSSYISL